LPSVSDIIAKKGRDIATVSRQTCVIDAVREMNEQVYNSGATTYSTGAKFKIAIEGDPGRRAIKFYYDQTGASGYTLAYTGKWAPGCIMRVAGGIYTTSLTHGTTKVYRAPAQFADKGHSATTVSWTGTNISSPGDGGVTRSGGTPSTWDSGARTDQTLEPKQDGVFYWSAADGTAARAARTSRARIFWFTRTNC